MKKLSVVTTLVFLALLSYGQSRIFTISNGLDINVTLTSPFQPIDAASDANLNITTLINELALQNVTINEAGLFSFETSVIDDVAYTSPFDLSITSNNNVLIYADLKNDTIGKINLFGLSNVIVGTGITWLPVYNLIPLPVYPPPALRAVEVASLMGSTLVDAAIYAAIVSPVVPAATTQLGRNKGSLLANITILTGNYTLVQGGGLDAHAIVGFGGPMNVESHDVDIRINVEEGNIWVTGGDQNAFAQIGNRNSGSFSLLGKLDVTARSVGVNVPMNGNTILEGGFGPHSEARIGHVHTSTDSLVDVGGRITLSDSSSLVLRAGSGINSDAHVGHRLKCQDIATVSGPISIEARLWAVVLDAASLTFGDSANCQIGHSAAAAQTLCQDSIFIITGGSLSAFSGTGTMHFTQIGHLGLLGSNDVVDGSIEINTGDSIVLRSDSGTMNYAQIGHHIRTAGAGLVTGHLTLRSGGRQLYTSLSANTMESFVKVGHHAGIIFDDAYLLAFDNIDLRSSAMPGNPAEAIIVAADTIRLISGDSINVQSNEAAAKISTGTGGAIVLLDALRDISFVSVAGMESAIDAPLAKEIRVRTADDIRITQNDLGTILLGGNIYLETDKEYFPDSLYGPQQVRTNYHSPFTVFNLGSGNLHAFPDGLGVVKFENAGLPTNISTVDGRIDIRSKSTSVDGTVTDLMISSLLPFSINPMSISGLILIGMDLTAGQLIDLGDSYENGLIEEWYILNSSELFFNVNQEIDVVNSQIELKSALLQTN